MQKNFLEVLPSSPNYSVNTGLNFYIHRLSLSTPCLLSSELHDLDALHQALLFVPTASVTHLTGPIPTTPTMTITEVINTRHQRYLVYTVQALITHYIITTSDEFNAYAEMSVRADLYDAIHDCLTQTAARLRPTPDASSKAISNYSHALTDVVFISLMRKCTTSKTLTPASDYFAQNFR